MPRHTNNFDFLRLMAASMVIWGHAYALLGEPGVPSFLGVSVSTYAVKIFFVLSGYLVVASWVRDPDFIRFFLKRALRIMPALTVVVCVAALLLGPIVTTVSLRDYFTSSLFHSYFQSILLKIHYSLPGVFETNIYPNAVNGSLWSLPTEVAMYVSVVLVGLLTRLFAGRYFTLIWTALTVLLLALHFAQFILKTGLFDGVIIYATLMSANIEVMPYFMVGGCLFLFRDQVPRSAIAAVALLLGGWFLARSGWPVESVLIFVTAYAVITMGTLSTPVICEFGRFGDISYGVYLYGFPVAQSLSFAFGLSLPFGGHIALTLLFSYALAFLSWHLVEKKAMRLKPRSNTTNAAEAQLNFK